MHLPLENFGRTVVFGLAKSCQPVESAVPFGGCFFYHMQAARVPCSPQMGAPRGVFVLVLAGMELTFFLGAGIFLLNPKHSTTSAPRKKVNMSWVWLG